MESLPGFKLDFRASATFATLAVCILLGLIFLVWLAFFKFKWRPCSP